jgi:predicted Zn-dependent peptidase
MHSHRLLFVSAVALLVSPAAAQPAAPKPAKSPARPALQLPEVETFTLANGLSVAVLPLTAAPVVAVQVWYHAGAKDEPANRRGSAHMFEHMMFKGTQHVPPEEHATLLNRLGGYVNAATDEDATHYINVLPAAYVDFGIELEAERMRNLVFRPAMIDTEREVVKEEIRGQENSPIVMGFRRFLEIAFTVHPYSATAGGTIADLDKTTPEDLQKFYDTYYQPGNALLVVVGDTTVAAVKASAEKHFGGIPKAPAPPRPADAAPEPPQTEARREVLEPSQIGLVFAGFKIPAAKDRDTYALQVASIILGSGESSRLKQRIKRADPKTKQPIGVEAALEIRVLEHPGILVAVGVYLDPNAAGAVEAALFDEIGKLGAKGPTADELRKAKNQVQAFFVTSLVDASGLANQIGRSWTLTGDATQWLRDLPEFEAVSAADVKRVVKQHLDAKRATVVVIPPKGR